MAHDGDDPPWVRPKQVMRSSTLPPPTSSSTTTPPPDRKASLTLLPPPHISSPAPAPASTRDDNEEYVGWRPQQMTVRQIAHSPPLSPLDLAMYPGAPIAPDPRRAVAGLKPLRILSSRRPGGPASAGPSRPPSVEANRPGSGFMGLFAAAKRASVTALVAPSSSGHSTPNPHAPIPVSPLPPPRTPPLVPQLALAPQLVGQVEPALKEYLEALAAQAAANPPSSSSRRGSAFASQQAQSSIDPVQEEEMLLEIRDLETGEIIKIRDLDAVNPPYTPAPAAPTVSETKESELGTKATHSPEILEPDQTTTLPPDSQSSSVAHNASQ